MAGAAAAVCRRKPSQPTTLETGRRLFRLGPTLNECLMRRVCVSVFICVCLRVCSINQHSFFLRVIVCFYIVEVGPALLLLCVRAKQCRSVKAAIGEHWEPLTTATRSVAQPKPPRRENNQSERNPKATTILKCRATGRVPAILSRLSPNERLTERGKTNGADRNFSIFSSLKRRGTRRPAAFDGGGGSGGGRGQ